MQKTAVIILSTMLLLLSAGCAPANKDELPTYDYSSFIGTWYCDDEIELTIMSVNGNKLTFSFIGGEDPLTYPIVDNEVKWQIDDAPRTLIFHEKSINYIIGERSYWLMEAKSPPYDYSILVGKWYPEDETESELIIMSIEGSEMTFSFFGGEDPVTCPIVDNRAEWTITAYDGEVSTLALVIHGDGIDYTCGDITTRYIKSVP